MDPYCQGYPSPTSNLNYKILYPLRRKGQFHSVHFFLAPSAIGSNEELFVDINRPGIIHFTTYDAFAQMCRIFFPSLANVNRENIVCSIR